MVGDEVSGMSGKSGTPVLLPGNTSCQGCPIAIAMRCLEVIENPVVVIPAGCSTVIAGLHPNSAMTIPVVHVPFASTTAVACGLSEAYKRIGVDANVIAWMGDGAADIGFATLSASASRNDDILTIVVDNEAYMNTGTQASLTTFWKAKTTTSPEGKSEERRNLALIMATHRIPYAATASIGYVRDLRKKMKKAGEMEGFRFIQVHSPCPPGWGFPSEKTIEIARMAVKSGAWVMWEYESGMFELSPPSRNVDFGSIGNYLKNQRRFKGLGEEDLSLIREKIREEWDYMLKLLDQKT